MKKTKVDLITGFLGAGKTTFLSGYLQYLKKTGRHAVVIENEYGRAGIDAQILGDDCPDIRELSGGCICCGLKVDFHDMLIQASGEYDHILVEPTGIYTVEDFLDIMQSPSMVPYCSIGSIVAIVDPAPLQPPFRTFRPGNPDEKLGQSFPRGL